MTREEIIDELIEMMELEEGDITEDTVLDDVEEWDSLTMLSLMAFAKKEFDKKLSTAQANEFEKVKDIVDFLIGG